MQSARTSASHVILCFNSGSSSVKFALYRLGAVEEVQLVHGAVERIGLADGHLWIRGTDNAALVDVQRDFPEPAAAAEGIFVAAKDLGLPPPVAVGHRVVHGGPDHTAPERVDASLLATLRRLVAFAPLHLPSAIQGIEAVAACFPGLPQVACFDTAFHRRMPEVAQRFPLPHDLWHAGIRRYGFHGLSYEYIVATLAPTTSRASGGHTTSAPRSARTQRGIEEGNICQANTSISFGMGRRPGVSADSTLA
jgi:acetate kinase